MNNVDRAKQFLAFDALSGLQQALREREIRHSRVEKIEISEDRGMRISNVLNKLMKGNLIQITFYLDGHYYELTDIVTKLQIPYKYLFLGNVKISFDDIYDIKIIKSIP